MLKFVPLLLLAGMVTAVIVAAPKPLKEGLVSHDGAGTGHFAKRDGMPDQTDFLARLKVQYVIAGQPGEMYMVELWLGRTGWRQPPYHFDTQQVTIPGDKGRKLTEVNGRFDRDYNDRDRGNPVKNPKPGDYPLFWVAPGNSWDCRLVIKKDGKVLSDTGYFRAFLLVEI